jgi:DNA-binding IclR family transcriptional regulator
MVKIETGVSTLDRVCVILNVFTEEEPILTLTEISRRIQLPKSTTHRLLTALEKHGMVLPDISGRGYHLGYQMVRWGTLAQASLDLRNIALPVMRAIVDTTGETAILSVLYQNMGIWIENVECKQPIRLALRMGKPLMLHAGASSKVLWAFLSDQEIEEILSQIELKPLMPNTITDPQVMREELRSIRENGYATSFEETDLGAMGIAAPIFDHSGKVIAGLGIVAPLSRVPRERVPEVAKIIVEASRQLSKRLGVAILSSSQGR